LMEPNYCEIISQIKIWITKTERIL
jgi:hypothetical protein